jgi:hypothetical protein
MGSKSAPPNKTGGYGQLLLSFTHDYLSFQICKNYWLSLQSNTMRARCYVCQEPFGESDVVMAPKCGHTFHKTCITQWLR